MGNVTPNNVKLTKPGQVTVHRQAQKLFDTIKSCFELRKFTKYIYIYDIHTKRSNVPVPSNFIGNAD